MWRVSPCHIFWGCISTIYYPFSFTSQTLILHTPLNAVFRLPFGPVGVTLRIFVSIMDGFPIFALIANSMLFFPSIAHARFTHKTAYFFILPDFLYFIREAVPCPVESPHILMNFLVLNCTFQCLFGLHSPICTRCYNTYSFTSSDSDSDYYDFLRTLEDFF